MKKFLFVIALTACSTDTSGTGPFPDSDTDPFLDGSGDHVASLSDGGGDAGFGAEDASDGPLTGDAGGPETGDAGEPVTGDAGLSEDSGADSGEVEPQGFAHELIVGSWSRVGDDAPRACDEHATVESTQCSVVDPIDRLVSCVGGTLVITPDYSLEEPIVDFLRWEGDVWVGEKTPSINSAARVMRLWLIEPYVMLEDWQEGDPATGLFCRARRYKRI